MCGSVRVVFGSTELPGEGLVAIGADKGGGKGQVVKALLFMAIKFNVKSAKIVVPKRSPIQVRTRQSVA
jgi:hypothetical protein